MARGLVAAALASTAAAGSPLASAPPAAPAGCSAPESRQFDFWVGRWEVFAAAAPDRRIAESSIERMYGGCAIRENWKPAGAGGGSLSAWIGAERGWRQTWVDSSGSWIEFRGGWHDDAMVLQGVWPQPGHPEQIMRMRYTVLQGGDVRQLGETSDDGGRSWQPNFDFRYRRMPGS